MLTILYFSSDCQKKSGLVILDDDDDDLIIRMWKSSKFPYGKYIII
jgi:hypothetical protein